MLGRPCLVLTDDGGHVVTILLLTYEATGVLLVGKDDQPRFQPVELGSSSGGQSAILSGVKPGSKVFIDLPPWAKKRD